MNKSTTDSLIGCAKDLSEIRAQLPNDLEPSIIELFESVIRRLEHCEKIANDQVALGALIDDGLQLAGRIGEVALVVAKIVDYYRW